MRPVHILPLPQPCTWCRPSWLAWRAEIARQTEDNLIGEDARRHARQHANHIQSLCARLHQGVPYYQPYLCEWIDPDREHGPVGCGADAADGSRFCARHLTEHTRLRAARDTTSRAAAPDKPA
jgi:hypothetical protein